MTVDEQELAGSQIKRRQGSEDSKPNKRASVRKSIGALGRGAEGFEGCTGWCRVSSPGPGALLFQLCWRGELASPCRHGTVTPSAPPHSPINPTPPLPVMSSPAQPSPAWPGSAGPALCQPSPVSGAPSAMLSIRSYSSSHARVPSDLIPTISGATSAHRTTPPCPKPPPPLSSCKLHTICGAKLAFQEKHTSLPSGERSPSVSPSKDKKSKLEALAFLYTVHHC